MTRAVERGIQQIVAFNNHFEANAARNAARLRRMLGQEAPEGEQNGLNFPGTDG